MSFSYILEETILINTVRLFYLSFLSGEPQEITTQILFVFPRPAEKLPGVNLPPSTSQPLLWWLNFTIIQIRLRERLGYKKKKKKTALLVSVTYWWKKAIYEADLEFNTRGMLRWKHVYFGLGFMYAKCWQRNVTLGVSEGQTHITVWLVGVLLNWCLNSSCWETVLIAVIKWQLPNLDCTHSSPGHLCSSLSR